MPIFKAIGACFEKPEVNHKVWPLGSKVTRICLVLFSESICACKIILAPSLDFYDFLKIISNLTRKWSLMTFEFNFTSNFCAQAKDHSCAKISSWLLVFLLELKLFIAKSHFWPLWPLCDLFDPWRSCDLNGEVVIVIVSKFGGNSLKHVEVMANWSVARYFEFDPELTLNICSRSRT